MKRLVERILMGSGALRRAAVRSGHTRIVLALHNVVDDTEVGRGDASLHMAVSHFRALLDELRRVGRIVPLGTMLARRGDPPPPMPEFAITFDDAYHGAMTQGLAAVREANAHATVFVAPGLLGAVDTWWDRAATGGAIDASRRDAWLDGDDAGLGDRIRPQVADSQAAALPASYAIAAPERLVQVAAYPQFAFGSHTWSHACLSALAVRPERTAELAQELERPRAWLQRFAADHGASIVSALAYPYGRVNADAMRAAAAAGYSAALRVDGGALAVDSPAMALPRINVPAAMRAAGIMLRATGWRA